METSRTAELTRNTNETQIEVSLKLDGEGKNEIATGIPFLAFWPTSDDTCEIDVHWFSPDWGEGDIPEVWEKRIKNFENILFEDTQFAPDIQASVSSPGFKGVLLNYQERRIYHWHEELDKKIGHNKMDQDYSIPSVLGPFIEK